MEFILTDTEAAIRAMLNKMSKSSSCRCPRMILKHQLYEIIINKTEVLFIVK